MRIHNAVAIATTDRSAQIQAKHTADASRVVQDLSDAAVLIKAGGFDQQGQSSPDPETAAIAEGWSQSIDRSSLKAPSSGNARARETISTEESARPTVSFWV